MSPALGGVDGNLPRAPGRALSGSRVCSEHVGEGCWGSSSQPRAHTAGTFAAELSPGLASEEVYLRTLSALGTIANPRAGFLVSPLWPEPAFEGGKSPCSPGALRSRRGVSVPPLGSNWRSRCPAVEGEPGCSCAGVGLFLPPPSGVPQVVPELLSSPSPGSFSTWTGEWDRVETH